MSARVLRIAVHGLKLKAGNAWRGDADYSVRFFVPHPDFDPNGLGGTSFGIDRSRVDRRVDWTPISTLAC